MFFAKIPRGSRLSGKIARGGSPYFGFYCIFINKCFEICLRGVLYLPFPLPLCASMFCVIDSNMIFFYSAMFTFEGIGIVLPLENKMKTPKGMPGWTGVLNTGMILVKRSTKMSTKIDLTNDARTKNTI
jgi:hypothetical protein